MSAKTWDSKWGAMVMLNFQNTDVTNWAGSNRYDASLPPLSQVWIVPPGATFYPVYAFAQFDGGAAGAGSVTLKLGGRYAQDIPGTASTTVVAADAANTMYMQFNSARACAATAGTYVNPVFVTSSDWENDASTGVMVQLLGYLANES